MCGKDFALIKTNTGNVYATGRVAGLGVKASSAAKWSDVQLHVKKLSVGHDGTHAAFITQDGAVYFAGTSRRGEDGEPGMIFNLYCIFAYFRYTRG